MCVFNLRISFMKKFFSIYISSSYFLVKINHIKIHFNNIWNTSVVNGTEKILELINHIIETIDVSQVCRVLVNINILYISYPHIRVYFHLKKKKKRFIRGKRWSYTP